jgi:hypothetical protein
VAPPVEKFDERIGALDQRASDAGEKFKAGDLSFEELQAETKAVERERGELEAAKLKADIASEQQVQTAEQRWQWEINRFYRRVEKDEGVKYTGSSLLLAALDTRVKELANVKENADKDSTWFLEEAHRQVKAELGIGKKAAAGARARGADRAAGAEDHAAELDGGDAVVSDFAELEKLEGLELENALARLPKHEADRYLSGD